MTYQSLKGFRDILPDEVAGWQWLEAKITTVADKYGYSELRLPLLESTELFTRGVGEGTDVIGKEMYSFLDRSVPPESISLRPELTAGAARAYIEHSIAQQQPITKWYYIGPAFRYEQPQAGRYRQFYTFGIELIGTEHPEADAEVILFGADMLRELGITNYRLRINSLGMPDERMVYRDALVGYLSERKDSLSQESQNRIETNPFRILDSKKEEDIQVIADAPEISEYLGDESREHFEKVQVILDACDTQYSIDQRLVRGLDYYTRTVFEFQGLDLGAQDALGGGGRYDRLIEEVGGKPTPAIGFGFGLDRLVLAAKAAGAMPEYQPKLDIYMIGIDEASRDWAVIESVALRRKGISVECDLKRRSMKAQMREANRKGATLVAIIGESEMEKQAVQLKNMVTHEQQEIQFALLAETLMKELAKMV